MMIRRQLSFSEIMSIAGAWQGIGGKPEADLGALEPLLWKEDGLHIPDVVAALTQRGFAVDLTTNGHLLERFAVDLKRAGLTPPTVLVGIPPTRRSSATYPAVAVTIWHFVGGSISPFNPASS